MSRLWSLIFLLCSAVLFQSCLDEGELDFPPDSTDTLTYTPSVAVQSLLRAVQNNSLTSDVNTTCIEVFYPIHLGFNNGLTITINNLDGLKEVARNGSIGQHVDKVVFPFLASKANEIRTIGKEEDLLDIIDECELFTLRDEVDMFYTQCFDFEYPIRMIDVNSNEVEIGSRQDYFAFEQQQGFEEQPVFVFPINVELFSDDKVVTVNNHFELFEAFDTCDKCPETKFTTDFTGGTSYIFRADFPGQDDGSISYEWFINDVSVEPGGATVQGDHVLEKTFEPGEFNVCLRATTPDCVLGITYCEFIVVEDPCPELSYEFDQINNSVYLFTANFPLKDEITYSWEILRETNVIFTEVEDASGDNMLEFQFDPGTYNVCLKAEVDGCPEVVKFCQDFVIQ